MREQFDENEAFIAAWQEDECFWNVNIQTYKVRNARKEGIKKLAQCTGMSGKYTPYFFQGLFYLCRLETCIQTIAFELLLSFSQRKRSRLKVLI